MKFFCLLLTIAVLASCGGGGGNVNLQPQTDTEQTPTVTNPPPVDPAVAELMTQLNAARAEIAGIPAAEHLELRINALEESLPTADIETLRRRLAEIMQEIQNIKSPPVDDSPAAACNANGMQWADFGIDSGIEPFCRQCPPSVPILNGNSCMAAVDDSPPDDPPPDDPPPADDSPTLSAFDTEEYQANGMYDAIQPLYAYERGYFGQGVTVAVVEYRPDFNVKHPDLAANYITVNIDGLGNHRVTATLSSFDFEDDHASRVAGLIGATRNGIGMHGIAPEVKMIPFSSAWITYTDVLGEFIETRKLTHQYIRENNIPIVNNSWSGQFSPERPVSVLLTMASSSRDRFVEAIGDTDSIYVWGSGNNGFSTPSSQALLPLFQDNLITNWVVAMAVDENENIQNYSNACGPTKDWCVATGVYNNTTPNHDDANNEYGYITGGRGTSFAAPQVSGALAILYEAIGIQSPQMARMILLTTTTDLGDPGVDDIYGWGLVNISAGIIMIENMKSAGTEEFSAVPFANLRGELPSGFAHLHNELSAIKLAIKLTTDLYYNVPLSEMLTPGNPKATPLGDAAAEMLENRGEETRRGIFAYGDINTELGLRYYGGGKGYSYIAEGNQSATNNFSGNFGGIGKISGKTYGGKLGFTKAIKANMQLFGDYERAAIIGKGEEGNLIKGARNARAESWTAGISFVNLWKHGDRIKLSANQEMKLSGGELIVRYPHAVGDFHKTFTGEETQKIEIRETFLPLKQKTKMRYTAGYAQKLNKKSEWATALEYNAGNNAKAISLIWQGEF